MECGIKMVKPSQTARLKTKLEELEKATDEMERSQKVVQTLANEADQYMTSLDFEEGSCKECFSQFTKKLNHICGQIDETAERSDDLSDQAEELFLDMKEYRSEIEGGVTCQGDHAK